LPLVGGALARGLERSRGARGRDSWIHGLGFGVKGVGSCNAGSEEGS